MRSAALLFFSLAVLLCPGCRSPSTVRLTAADAGQSIELAPGREMTVTLEANPTTGYTWERAGEGAGVLRQVGEAAFEPESQALGAGGVQMLRFRAVAPGRTTLRMAYRRPWEQDVEPERSFAIEVVVR